MENTREGEFMKSAYRTLSIPADLMQSIEEFIKKNKEGYTSITEFSKVAIREKLEREKGAGKYGNNK